MKHISAVIPSHSMNNWDILGQGIILGENEYRVTFHRDPRMSIMHGKVNFNFDIIVNDGLLTIDDMKVENLVPVNRIHTIRRYNKVEQQTRLLARVAFERESDEDRDLFKNFVPVVMHHQRQSSGATLLVNPTDKVVVKPLDGARGIGQFLIDPTVIPLSVIVDLLDTFRRDQITREDVLKKLHKFDPQLKYATAGEKYEGEGFDAIKSQGFCVQDHINNIKSEYRLITGHNGEIVYCQRRSIRSQTEDGFRQATGSETNSAKGTDIMSINDVLSADDREALLELTTTVIGPLSSIDLFITMDNKWGIFEYCNQFGIKGVPPKLVEKMHADMLMKMIRTAGL